MLGYGRRFWRRLEATLKWWEFVMGFILAAISPVTERLLLGDLHWKSYIAVVVLTYLGFLLFLYLPGKALFLLIARDKELEIVSADFEQFKRLDWDSKLGRLDRWIVNGKHFAEANFVPPENASYEIASCWVEAVRHWRDNAERQLKSDWPHPPDLSDTTGMSHAIEPNVHKNVGNPLNHLKHNLLILRTFRQSLPK